MRGVATIWLQGIEPDKRDEFEKILRNNSYLLLQLKSILRRKMEALDGPDRTEADFDSPSWALKQANRIGKRSSYQEIIDLFAFLEG